KVHLLGKVAGDAAKKLSEETLGVEWESAEAKLPVDLLLQVLYDRDPLSFDAYVYQAVEQQEGLVWEPGEAEVIREAFPLQPSRHVLIFEEGKCAVRGVPARDQGPFVSRVLQAWSDGKPAPVRQPVRRVATVALIFTVPAALFAYGGYSMAKNPA